MRVMSSKGTISKRCLSQEPQDPQELESVLYHTLWIKALHKGNTYVSSMTSVSYIEYAYIEGVTRAYLVISIMLQGGSSSRCEYTGIHSFVHVFKINNNNNNKYLYNTFL